MQQELLAWLKKPYGIVTSCALCTGIAVGTIEDLRRWAIVKASALMSTPISTQEACVNQYLDTRQQMPEGPYLIILTDLVNDSNLSQTRKVDQNLRRLYGQDVGGAIQLESVPCTIYPTAGNAADRYAIAGQTALDIAQRAKADVVIWGEVVENDNQIALSMTHATDTEASDYTVEKNTLSTDFGEDIGTLIAAKMLTLVRLSGADENTYLVDRMQRVLHLTEPLVANPPASMASADRASLHFSKGTALFYIGQQSADPESLRAAVKAFDTALEGYAARIFDEEWAATQASKGNALQVLANFDAGTENLTAAIAAYTAALDVYTQKASALEWAAVQNNLGNAQRVLGEHGDGTDFLDAALVSFNAALEVYTKNNAPHDWASIQNNIGLTFSSLGQCKKDPKLLESAVKAFNLALEVNTQTSAPIGWAVTQNNLGMVLTHLGQTEGDTTRLNEAEAALDAALLVHSRDLMPLAWAVTTLNLAQLDYTRFEHGKDPALLASALSLATDARAVFGDISANQYLPLADALLAEITKRQLP